MQRQQDQGIIISCDFCGRDWDPADTSYLHPMIEGHHGSVLCLECLQIAIRKLTPAAASVACTMCLRQYPAGTDGYAPAPTPRNNAGAWLCHDCLHQARQVFSRDPHVAWKA